jgi:ABC-type Zn uptake system ZnuABC Zn-binding protein ZnuA
MHTKSYRTLWLYFITWLTLTALVAACAPAGGLDEPAGKLRVVATTNIVGDVVAQIGGEWIALQVLLPAGTDPHAFEPRPQDVAAVVDADLIFANGAGLEEFLEVLIESAGAQDQLIEVSTGIELLPFEMLHEDEEAHTEEEIHSDGDPHTWMDPNNVMMWVENITSALSAADPEHAAAYQANASAYQTKLVELDQWIRAQVDAIPPQQRQLVSDHRIFSYFAEEYGFTLAGEVIGSFSTNAQSSAKELAAIEDRIRQINAQAIFIDQSANPTLASQIAADTGIKMVTIYTGSLGSAESPAGTYLDFMRYNVTAIVEALK